MTYPNLAVSERASTQCTPGAFHNDEEMMFSMDQYFTAVVERETDLLRENDPGNGEIIETSVFIDLLARASNPDTETKPRFAPPLTNKDKPLDILAVYKDQVSRYEPMSRKEEEVVFKDLDNVRVNLLRAMAGLPASDRTLLVPLCKGLYQHYSTFRKHAMSLTPEVSSEILALLEQYTALRDKIVQSNLRFVFRIANGFWRDGNVETLKTLISAGNIGLFIAIDKFDTSRGLRFMSYAASWIALEVRLELASERLVQIPRWWQRLLKKMYDTARAARKEITPEELAAKAMVPLRYVNQLNNFSKVVNCDNFIIASHPVELTETREAQTDSRQESLDDALACKQVRRHLQTFISTLSTKEQGVVRLMYGLAPGDHDYNLRQVGQIFNLSTERVRQIKEGALGSLRRKLRHVGYRSYQDFCG